MARNFARATVAVAPSPATSGLVLTVRDGEGEWLEAGRPAAFVPPGALATPDNAEIVTVSAVAGDVVTLSARGSEGTTPRAVTAGWRIEQGLTAAELDDISPDLVADLYATPGFVIGHRLGGGDEAPEMTEIGSEQALSKGQAAVELSSQPTVDGVLIGLHDTGSTSLERTTSLTGEAGTKSLAQLRSAAVVDIGASHLGAGWSAPQWIPLTGNELRRWERRGVVFLEPKVDATRNLAAVTAFRDPGKWVVHKFNRSANGSLPQHALNARAAGLPLWIYMTVGDSNSLVDQVLATLTGPNDAIGVDVDASDAHISYVCQQAALLGIPVIGFVVRLRSQRDRLAGLGVDGYMTTSPTYIGSDVAAFTSDGFAGLVRRPGEYEGASNKLIGGFDGAEGSVTLAQGTTATLSMGSMCPVAQADGLAGGYTIEGATRWATVDGSTAHSDIYFGHASDSPYAHQGLTNEPGYTAMIGMDGRIRLFTHVNGSSTLTQIGSTVNTTPPQAGVWVPWLITVTDTTVSFARTNDVTTPTTATHSLYRGGYFGLASASTSVAAQFKDLVVTAL